MSKTREFLDDWTSLPEKEIFENIKYLLAHYKDYKIKIYDDKALRIGNILILRFDFNIHGAIQPVYNIACTSFSDKDPEGIMLAKLVDFCKKEVKEQEKHQSKKRNMILCSWLVIMFATFCYASVWCAKENKKTQKIEEQVKDYEKTLLYYKEYEQTQKQIQNYRDSLQNARIK